MFQAAHCGGRVASCQRTGGRDDGENGITCWRKTAGERILCCRPLPAGTLCCSAPLCSALTNHCCWCDCGWQIVLPLSYSHFACSPQSPVLCCSQAASLTSALRHFQRSVRSDVCHGECEASLTLWLIVCSPDLLVTIGALVQDLWGP